MLARLSSCCALVAAEQDARSWWPAALGGVLGLAILGNTRLALLPLVLGISAHGASAARRTLAALLVVCACAALVLAPWVVRNDVQVGCFAITTDARALWKANNLNTYDVLARGGWIDDVPEHPGRATEAAGRGAIWREPDRIVEVDECAQMRFYREEVVEFWREHPGEKVRLAGQATRMLWQPNVTSETEVGRAAGPGAARAWLSSRPS